jgi:hypothetical protein
MQDAAAEASRHTRALPYTITVFLLTFGSLLIFLIWTCHVGHQAPPGAQALRCAGEAILAAMTAISVPSSLVVC